MVNNLMIALTVWGVICFWGLYSINRTGYQRSKIINLYFKCNNWRELNEDFDAVDFGQHIVANFLPWKDWRNLYSQRMRDAVPEAFK